ncbi:hypothetical protein [Prosthecobacter sp.]|uniref:hypothetical protein n=1 Tax=Prosthecobacter sp. TaxID=1965333 RepID=UPI0037841225
MRTTIIIAWVLLIGRSSARDISVLVAEGFSQKPESECVLYDSHQEKMPPGTLGKKNEVIFTNLAKGTYSLVCWSSSVSGWTESPRCDATVVINDDQGPPLKFNMPECNNEVQLHLDSPVDLKTFFPGFSAVPCRIQRYREGAPDAFGYRWIWLNQTKQGPYEGTVHHMAEGAYVLSIPFFLNGESSVDAPGEGRCILAAPFDCFNGPNGKAVIEIAVKTTRKTSEVKPRK